MESSAPGSKLTNVSVWIQFLAVSVIAGVVAAGMAIPAIGVATSGANSMLNVFKSLPSELDEQPLAEKSTVLAADGSQIATFYWQNRVEVPLDDISQNMQDATVAVEDYRFFDHGGVDPQGIARAFVHNMFSSSKQGGSTLTQQYVKSVLRENANAAGDDERAAAAVESEGTSGYARKLREAKLSVAVENKYGKEEILHRYLNINNYSGSPNVYGVEAAAQRYWGIPAKDLNVAQSATLAGIVKNPYAYNPERNPEETLERRNVVLNLMLKHGKITQKEHDEAKKSDLDLDVHETSNGCTAAGADAYFCDYVQTVIQSDETFGKTQEERDQLLKRGGLTIHTSLNPKLQKAADKAVKDRVPVGDPSGAGHSAVTVEPGTGKVLAMVQNREYSVVDGEENVNTSLNYNTDKAHHGAGGFQVGSNWKPFVLAEWLKEGKGLYTTFNGNKDSYPASAWTYNGCDGANAAPWAPANSGEGDAKAVMSALEATKGSVNSGYARMASQINMCGIMDTATDLGVKQGNGDSLDTPNAQGTTLALVPSSVLGIVQVAPVDVASAYATFAAGGTYCKPTPITGIEDRNGDKLKVHSAGCKQALDEDVAEGVAWALTQTFQGGTTDKLKIGAPAGAKTGTTNFEVGSTWLSGFTKTMSTSVWTGDPDGVRDWRYNYEGAVKGKVYGATYSGKTWQDYMKNAVKIVDGNTEFAKPGGKVGGDGGSTVKQPASDGGEKKSSDGGEKKKSSDSSDKKKDEKKEEKKSEKKKDEKSEEKKKDNPGFGD